MRASNCKGSIGKICKLDAGHYINSFFYTCYRVAQYACSILFTWYKATRNDANKGLAACIHFTAASKVPNLLTLLSDSVAPVLLGTHMMGTTLVCFARVCNQQNKHRAGTSHHRVDEPLKAQMCQLGPAGLVPGTLLLHIRPWCLRRSQEGQHCCMRQSFPAMRCCLTYSWRVCTHVLRSRLKPIAIHSTASCTDKPTCTILIWFETSVQGLRQEVDSRPSAMPVLKCAGHHRSERAYAKSGI